tara:strand:- start:121 stop:696 length:576 start_codon:yes stop_codon:yes gene_type:complete
MKRNIIVAKKAISPALCNLIIDRCKNNFIPASVGNATPQGQVNKKIRTSEVSFIRSVIKNLDIFIPILQLIKYTNDKFYQFDIEEPETLQITRYDEKNQGFYEPHEDAHYDNVNPDLLVRKLSMSIQLTAPEYYKGGEFVFPDDKDKFNVEDSMEQGTVIFFPSYIKHGVQPVTEGVRYSCVSWLLGNHFK